MTTPWCDYPESIEGMIFEDCTLSIEDSFKDSWLPAAIEIVGEENADPVAKDSTGDCGHFPFLESPKEWAAALDDYKDLCNK